MRSVLLLFCFLDFASVVAQGMANEGLLRAVWMHIFTCTYLQKSHTLIHAYICT